MDNQDSRDLNSTENLDLLSLVAEARKSYEEANSSHNNSTESIVEVKNYEEECLSQDISTNLEDMEVENVTIGDYINSSERKTGDENSSSKSVDFDLKTNDGAKNSNNINASCSKDIAAGKVVNEAPSTIKPTQVNSSPGRPKLTRAHLSLEYNKQERLKKRRRSIFDIDDEDEEDLEEFETLKPTIKPCDSIENTKSSKNENIETLKHSLQNTVSSEKMQNEKHFKISNSEENTMEKDKIPNKLNERSLSNDNLNKLISGELKEEMVITELDTNKTKITTEKEENKTKEIDREMLTAEKEIVSTQFKKIAQTEETSTEREKDLKSFKEQENDETQASKTDTGSIAAENKENKKENTLANGIENMEEMDTENSKETVTSINKNAGSLTSLPEHEKNSEKQTGSEEKKVIQIENKEETVSSPMEMEVENVSLPDEKENEKKYSPDEKKEDVVPSPVEKEEEKALSPVEKEVGKVPSPIEKEEEKAHSPVEKDEERAPSPIEKEEEKAPLPVEKEEEKASSPVEKDEERAPSPVEKDEERAPSPVKKEEEKAPSLVKNKVEALSSPIEKEEATVPSPGEKEYQTVSSSAEKKGKIVATENEEQSVTLPDKKVKETVNNEEKKGETVTSPSRKEELWLSPANKEETLISPLEKDKVGIIATKNKKLGDIAFTAAENVEKLFEASVKNNETVSQLSKKGDETITQVSKKIKETLASEIKTTEESILSASEKAEDSITEKAGKNESLVTEETEEAVAPASKNTKEAESLATEKEEETKTSPDKRFASTNENSDETVDDSNDKVQETVYFANKDEEKTISSVIEKSKESVTNVFEKIEETIITSTKSEKTTTVAENIDKPANKIENDSISADKDMRTAPTATEINELSIKTAVSEKVLEPDTTSTTEKTERKLIKSDRSTKLQKNEQESSVTTVGAEKVSIIEPEPQKLNEKIFSDTEKEKKLIALDIKIPEGKIVKEGSTITKDKKEMETVQNRGEEIEKNVKESGKRKDVSVNKEKDYEKTKNDLPKKSTTDIISNNSNETKRKSGNDGDIHISDSTKKIKKEATEAMQLKRKNDVNEDPKSKKPCIDQPVETSAKATKSHSEPVCKECQNIWSPYTLKLLFEGSEAVTVNSRVTYGAIILMNKYAQEKFPNDSDSFVHALLERADLGKGVRKMDISYLVKWLIHLISGDKIKCCHVFSIAHKSNFYAIRTSTGQVFCNSYKKGVLANKMDAEKEAKMPIKSEVINKDQVTKTLNPPKTDLQTNKEVNEKTKITTNVNQNKMQHSAKTVNIQDTAMKTKPITSIKSEKLKEVATPKIIKAQPFNPDLDINKILKKKREEQCSESPGGTKSKITYDFNKLVFPEWFGVILNKDCKRSSSHEAAYDSVAMELTRLSPDVARVFSYLPLEIFNIRTVDNVNKRYTTNREVLALHWIHENSFDLTKEKYLQQYYKCFFQILLNRSEVLLIPNGKELYKRTDVLYKSFMRSRLSRGVHFLNAKFDNGGVNCCPLFETNKNIERVKVLVVDVLSVFAVWRNLNLISHLQIEQFTLKDVLRKVTCRKLNSVDCLSLCLKFHEKLCNYMIVESDIELTWKLLNEPFVGVNTKVSKKHLNSSGNKTEAAKKKYNHIDPVDMLWSKYLRHECKTNFESLRNKSKLHIERRLHEVTQREQTLTRDIKDGVKKGMIYDYANKKLELEHYKRAKSMLLLPKQEVIDDVKVSPKIQGIILALLERGILVQHIVPVLNASAQVIPFKERCPTVQEVEKIAKEYGYV